MKYIVRAIKYLFYFILLFAVIVLVLWFLMYRRQGIPITELFEPGAYPKMGLFFVLVAAVYPAISFVRRKLTLGGPYSRDRKTIDGIMKEAGYRVETETPEKVTYRLEKASLRFTRMYEDRVTIDIHEDPIVFEGYRKDVDRIVRFIAYRLSREEEVVETETSAPEIENGTDVSQNTENEDKA